MNTQNDDQSRLTASSGWKTDSSCTECQRPIHLTAFDVWAAGEKHPFARTMCKCPYCGHHFPVEVPDQLIEFLPNGYSAWLKSVDAAIVPDPVDALAMSTSMTKSPVVRLLEGIASVLACRFNWIGAVVSVDLIQPDGSPARPEFQGCLSNTVIGEAIERLSRRWKVTPLRFADNDAPYRLLIQARTT